LDILFQLFNTANNFKMFGVVSLVGAFGLLLGAEARAITPSSDGLLEKREPLASVPPIYGFRMPSLRSLNRRQLATAPEIKNAVNFYWGDDGKSGS
jgi:hypothetical protein